MKLEVGRVHASLHHRLLHARQHKLGEACVASVAQASRDEERAEDEEQGAKVAESPKDEGPNAAYITFSLAAVMTLGIANRVLCVVCCVFAIASFTVFAAATVGLDLCAVAWARYKMALQPLGDYVFFLAQYVTSIVQAGSARGLDDLVSRILRLGARAGSRPSATLLCTLLSCSFGIGKSVY